MKKKSNRKHRSEGDKYYIPFLPDEVFNNLSPTLKEVQREYRIYHRTIHDINKRISDNQGMIKRLREQIENDRFRLKEKASENHEDGYEELMASRYQKLVHLYDDFKFSVSLSPKDRTSESYKKNQRDLEEYGELMDTEGDYRKKFYGGKEIGVVRSWNAQVKSDNYKYSLIPELEKGKKIKNIILGTEEVMRMNLGTLYDLDYSKDDIEEIKDEWRTIVRAYSNWYITKKGWKGFKLDTHPKEKIVEWCIKMGINEKDGEFDNWISKEG